jgi:hypothetical protein
MFKNKPDERPAARDCPGMQAKAADNLLPFDQRDAVALFGRSEDGFLAGRATPDHDEIVLES